MGSRSVFKILLSTLALMISSGCNPRISTITAIEGTQTLPETYENPQDLPGPAAEPPLQTEPEIKPQPPVIKPAPQTTPQPQLPATVAPVAPKILLKTLLKPPAFIFTKKSVVRPGLPRASNFIISAEWVMINEGKKIGTPCNFYLSRVLVVSGYSKDKFLATDFDIYAKKNLKNFEVSHFINDGKGSELARLKRHLWSFPERTPFIMQWSRSGTMGHVAIVERIGNMLIIYQASLNRHSARKDYTSINRLLSGEMRRTLSVYSGF